MDTLTRSTSVHYRARSWRESGHKVALIPTRGTLHKGHMSLVATAQDLAEHVIVSVFAEDGHTHEADRELLANVGADVLFMPPVQELYTGGRESSAVVRLPELEDVLEGVGRPGHLAAMMTVHLKLLNIVHPDVVLFGERDYQQLVMLRRLVQDLFFTTEVVSCPILRDGDGLAVATSNRDFRPEQRALAPQLHAALEAMARDIDAGRRDYDELERQCVAKLAGAGFAVDYLLVRQAQDLARIQSGTRDLVIVAAARLGPHRLTDSQRVRLIDRY